MICYIDEKMYGPLPEGKTMEQLEEEIRQLEIQYYGHPLDHSEPVSATAPVRNVIYDIKQHKEIDVEEFLKTEEGKRHMEACERWNEELLTDDEDEV